MKRNTRTNKVNRNQSATMNEVTMARKAQFIKLRNHALKNECWFLAEYYENMSKENN